MLAKKDPEIADLLIDILFVGLVVAGSTAFLLLKQAISTAQEDNKNLVSENKELKADNNRLGPQLKLFDDFFEKQSFMRQEIIKLANDLQEALADGAKKTQERQEIQYFLDKLTDVEKIMSDDSELIKAAKKLSEEKGSRTKKAIERVFPEKKSWFKKLLGLQR